MNKNIKSELMYRLSDYIGAYAVMDAMRAGMNQAHHVKTFLDMENRLIEGIDEAKRQYEADGKTDNNLYGLIVGAESAIKAANETIKADGKGYSFSLVKM